MEKNEKLAQMLADLPEGFRPLSPLSDSPAGSDTGDTYGTEQDLTAESDTSDSVDGTDRKAELDSVADCAKGEAVVTEMSSQIEQDHKTNQDCWKRQTDVEKNTNEFSVKTEINDTECSPSKKRKEYTGKEVDNRENEQSLVCSSEQVNTQTFSPDVLGLQHSSVASPNANEHMTAAPITSGDDVQDNNEPLNLSGSNEADDIVRKLCKNGKVMEFQEGDDFIKVIVYEDSQEDDSEKDANLSNMFQRPPVCSKGDSNTSFPSSSFHSKNMLPPTVPQMPFNTNQTMYHTPHPRNGYMFYADNITPLSAQDMRINRAQMSSNSQSFVPNYRQGMTPNTHRNSTPLSQNVLLNSSGEENISPTETLNTPNSEQIQKKVRSLIGISKYQMEDDTPKLREQHNQKERRRRARIKEACNLLRQLVPGMSDKTDKATVFEFAARYVHFLKSHTGAQFDKDFLMKYSPY